MIRLGYLTQSKFNPKQNLKIKLVENKDQETLSRNKVKQWIIEIFRDMVIMT